MYINNNIVIEIINDELYILFVKINFLLDNTIILQSMCIV